jgi:hypothetical protein
MGLIFPSTRGANQCPTYNYLVAVVSTEVVSVATESVATESTATAVESAAVVSCVLALPVHAVKEAITTRARINFLIFSLFKVNIRFWYSNQT